MREFLDEIEKGSIKDPMRAASQSMKKQLPKRFYQNVDVYRGDERFEIHLDGRPVKTPMGEKLVVATKLAGQVVAEEWRTQEHHIDPLRMPVTRLLNTSIDGVSKDMQAVKEDIIRFAGSDLLCYRAESPENLVIIEQQHWDPLIDWAHGSLGAKFQVQQGLVHVTQPAETIAAFSVHVGLIDDPAKLALLHSLTAISGSAILSMALFKHQVSLEEAWAAAHVDEDWQVLQWGEDDEATAHRNARKQEFDAAMRLLDALEG